MNHQDKKRGSGLLAAFAVLMSSEGIARVLGVVLTVVLARVLGVEDFGTFSFALNYGLLASVFVDFGQNTHLSRVVAADQVMGPAAFQRVVVSKSILTIVIGLGTLGVLPLFGFTSQSTLAAFAFVLWGGMLSMVDGLRAIARSIGWMRFDAALNSGESLGRVAAIILCATVGLGQAWYYGSLLAVMAVALCLGYVSLKRRVDLGSAGAKNIRASRVFLSESIGLGMLSLMLTSFVRVDQVLVLGLAGAEANGIYAAAMRIALAAGVVPTVVLAAGYPDLVRSRTNRDGLSRNLWAIGALAIGSSLAAGMVLGVVAPALIGVLYGQEYLDAIPVLRILSVMVAVSGLTRVALNTLTAMGRERVGAYVVATVLAATVALDYALIPKYGAVAAASISVAGEVAIGVAGCALVVGLLRRMAPSYE